VNGPPMRVHLTAAPHRRDEIIRYAELLTDTGRVTVLSSWLAGGQVTAAGEPVGDNGRLLLQGGGAEADKARVDVAEGYLRDVVAADMVVVFTEAPGTATTTHVELGFALAHGVPLVLVGPRDTVFDWLPDIQWCPSWDVAFDYIRSAANWA